MIRNCQSVWRRGALPLPPLPLSSASPTAGFPWSRATISPSRPRRTSGRSPKSAASRARPATRASLPRPSTSRPTSASTARCASSPTSATRTTDWMRSISTTCRSRLTAAIRRERLSPTLRRGPAPRRGHHRRGRDRGCPRHGLLETRSHRPRERWDMAGSRPVQCRTECRGYDQRKCHQRLERSWLSRDQRDHQHTEDRG